MQKQKIVMLEASGHGKICHSTFSLCHALARNGYDVTLITSRDYELDELPRAFGVLKLFPCKGSYLFPWYFYLIFRKVRALKPGILHFQWFPSATLGYALLKLLKLACRARLVYTPHNVVPHRKRFSSMARWARIYREMDAIIVHSQYAKMAIADIFEVDAARITVTPETFLFDDSVIDYDAMEARRRLNLPVEARVILFFGYINHSKGVDQLIAAFPAIQRAVPGAALALAGSAGENGSGAETLRRAAGDNRNIILDLRYIPFKRMLMYFMAADVVTAPYRKICQSPIIKLARAFGKAAVATPMAVEDCDDREGVFIAASAGAEDIASAVITALRSLEGKREGAPRAAHPGWREIASGARNVYAALLDGEPAGMFSGAAGADRAGY